MPLNMRHLQARANPGSTLFIFRNEQVGGSSPLVGSPEIGFVGHTLSAKAAGCSAPWCLSGADELPLLLVMAIAGLGISF